MSLLKRLDTWIESLSDTMRPAAYGALFIVMFMLLRGAWLIAPIAVIYVFATSDTPWVELARGATVVALAMVGGAASGLAYGAVGRHLRNAFAAGRYLAGIIAATPYMFLLPFIGRVIEKKPIIAPLDKSDMVIGAIMALFFGSAIGHSWLAPSEPRTRSPRSGQPNER